MPHASAATARTPSISGNGWIALGVIGFFVITIYMLIRGALFVDRRDMGYGRGRRRTDDGWFGIFPSNPADDEDAPDYHHHHNGGSDSGEGGEGGSY
jgi:hypothetical protein